MEKKVTTVAKVLSELDRRCDQITHQQQTVEAEIWESSKRLHQIIDNRQDHLIGQLDPHHQEKAEKPCSTERPDRDPSGSAQQLLGVYEGEPQGGHSAA